VTVAVEWLTVGGQVEPWQRAGLLVTDDGLIPLFGPGLRLGGEPESGIRGWTLSGLTAAVTTIDGLPTELVAPSVPLLAEHPLGAIGLDHVVVATDDLQRTSRALEAATGSPLRRVRELGELRQGFHRLGPLIVELVERTGMVEGPATFWGLVLNVEDLDVAVSNLGPELIGPVKAAVQPGRSIATFRAEAGLGLPVALMTP
jgi:hypothetical protein